MTTAIGIVPDIGISIQEYWLGNAAHYAISNADQHRAALTLCVWSGGAYREAIAGPWELAPAAVETFPLPVAARAPDSLWALRRHDGEPVGRLRPPIAPEGAALENQSCVLTNDGFNGTGEKLRDVWCAQDALWFTSGASIVLEWQVPTSPRKLRVALGAAEARGRAAFTGVSCDTLRVEQNGGQAVVDARETRESRPFHRVRLTIQLPVVSAPTLVPADGRIAIEGGGAFPFQRGLLVRPDNRIEK